MHCYLEVIPPEDSPLQPLRVPVSDQADATRKIPMLATGEYSTGCATRFHVCRHDDGESCSVALWNGEAFIPEVSDAE